MTTVVNKTIIPVAGVATHAVSPPPPNHIYWPVVRANDGVEVDRCPDFNTAVARAKVLAAQAAQLGLPT
jgi:hypothetical protein